MNLAGIIEDSIVDGEGIRAVIFISGCKHNCKGCHNKESQSFDYGKLFTTELQDEIINKVKNNMLCDGITISGGDALYSCDELTVFLKKFKEVCPDKNVWLYTGFTYGNLPENTPLKYIDVIVDGPYIEELRDFNPSNFRGSTNQKIVKISQRY
jgi:anaerobic ribonucleoside-triphosphate reductase activating protein